MADPKYAERFLSMGSKGGVGQINQNAVEIKKKPVSCGGLPFRRCWARNPAMRCGNVRSSAQSLCFRQTDYQSQHECEAGVIGQAASKFGLKKPILIFLSARVRQHSNRLGEENVSSLVVSECWNRRFKCSHIEFRHRAHKCFFDELAI